ncbi:MAG: preprotein translocase subunit SecE [Firmicutes bacterium]|nr:preprotein translocase subunit SecE [Bacillota bacterium]
MANSNVSVEKKQSKVKNFFRGVWSELKKVHWPNKKQIINYTGIVLLFIFVVAIAIFVVDSILDFLLGFIVK